MNWCANSAYPSRQSVGILMRSRNKEQLVALMVVCCTQVDSPALRNLMRSNQQTGKQNERSPLKLQKLLMTKRLFFSTEARPRTKWRGFWQDDHFRSSPTVCQLPICLLLSREQILSCLVVLFRHEPAFASAPTPMNC